ncbi:branched-chain amino acid ABC transporter permease [Halomarina litorea]|uniref:branched-chain amino acid ABC transporter permease n=1 Tax=Halomarina litorea TaxID=2961595 RepID=UPI0020C5B376|nr:branched-chain amino acid ABC transporter permease [Halomarina sp. BCD28]
MSTDTESESGRFGLGKTGTDLALMIGMMLALYVVFAGVGMVLGFPLFGIVNLVRELTFFVAVYAIVALALNLHWGYAGLFNIGVAGFMAVGAYALGLLSGSPAGSPPGLGLPLFLGVPLGMGVAALVGLVAALPALRLKADYLAIVTIALAEIIRLTFVSRAFEDITGGAAGFGNFPANPANTLLLTDPSSLASDPTAVGGVVFGLFESIGIASPKVAIDSTYAVMLLLVVALVYVFLRRLGNSPFGRVLKAIREDELVAQSLGKDTNRFKIKVFMVGCALMGLGGMLWQALGTGSVNPTNNFLPQITFYIFIAVIIGGAGSNTGSVLGAGLFAGVLFLLPSYVDNLVNSLNLLQNTTTPQTFIDAVAPVASLELAPFFAYALGNIDQLRFVLIGVLLVWLMQNRPDGLLGHRQEPAASVDLMRRTSGSKPPRGEPAADGGESDE